MRSGKKLSCASGATAEFLGWLSATLLGHSSPVATISQRELMTSLLREVSRSFYLTMRVLPGAIRPQISLAYLLARTTDTIADTELVPVAERLAALAQLRGRIAAGGTGRRLDFGRLLLGGATGATPTARAERVLLERVEEALSLLTGLEAADRQRLGEVLAIITSGQELDLRRFESESLAAGEGSLTALRTEAELDDYTYRVAGCVGEFWTRMCRAHLFPAAPLDDAWLLAQGIRFGQGLQLVNILRDLPADLRRGRCYLPAERLAEAGLEPADLLTPANEPRLRSLYHGWLDAAQAHLAAGWDYTCALPRRQFRVRLACAWPVLIGVQTLGQLRAANPLDPAQRVKVSRREVRSILLRSTLASGSARAWRGLFPGPRT